MGNPGTHHCCGSYRVCGSKRDYMQGWGRLWKLPDTRQQDFLKQRRYTLLFLSEKQIIWRLLPFRLVLLSLNTLVSMESVIFSSHFMIWTGTNTNTLLTSVSDDTDIGSCLKMCDSDVTCTMVLHSAALSDCVLLSAPPSCTRNTISKGYQMYGKRTKADGCSRSSRYEPINNP